MRQLRTFFAIVVAFAPWPFMIGGFVWDFGGRRSGILTTAGLSMILLLLLLFVINTVKRDFYFWWIQFSAFSHPDFVPTFFAGLLMLMAMISNPLLTIASLVLALGNLMVLRFQQQYRIRWNELRQTQPYATRETLMRSLIAEIEPVP